MGTLGLFQQQPSTKVDKRKTCCAAVVNAEYVHGFSLSADAKVKKAN